MENLTSEQIKELARQKKNEYQKNWYDSKKSEGIDKRKEYQTRYWEKKALEELKENQA